MKTVEVKKCCWVCKHYLIDWEAEAEYCELPKHYFMDEFNTVCPEFELKEELKPKEGDKNGE